jgi:hypothetical protein
VGSGNLFQLGQSFTWSPLGRLETDTYPQLGGDPVPPQAVPAPARTLTSTFTNGTLTQVSQGATDYASSISYHPNGMVNTVVHGNAVWDVY